MIVTTCIMFSTEKATRSYQLIDGDFFDHFVSMICFTFKLQCVLESPRTTEL